MGSKSRNKGKRGERELAAELTRLIAPCRRGQQFSGLEGEDVVGLSGVHIECKRTETLSLYAAMEQAETDAAASCVPIVCHRRNGRRWLVVCYLDDLPELAKRIEEMKRWADGN